MRAMLPAQPYVSSSACGVMTSSRCRARNSSPNTFGLRSTYWCLLVVRRLGELILDDVSDDLVEVPLRIETQQRTGSGDVRDPAHGVLEPVPVRLLVGDVSDLAGGAGEGDHP